MSYGIAGKVVAAAGDDVVKAHDGTRPSVKSLCLFLSQYAAWLLGSGATCMRLDRNVDRIAKAFHKVAVMTIMPRHIHMTVCNDGNTESYTCITPIGCSCISFDINTQLSELSWSISDGKVDFNHAKRKFKEICSTKPANKWMVLILASLANSAFCGLFGGSAEAMLLVGVATLFGFHLKQIMASHNVDVRIIFIICAFVSTVIASTGWLFNWGATPDIAIATSVLYLVPGIPFLNSFSDLLAGHYISAVSRFMHAVILTASLSLGLCAGMMAMNIGMF